MKLIIDIPEDLYKWIKDEYDNPNGEVAYSAIENGKPYNLTGDLISRSALIEEVQDWVDPFVLTFINNAPTVEPCYNTSSCSDCKNYDKENHNCPRYCEVIKEALTAIKSRPQGRWISDYRTCKCSACNFTTVIDTYNFCPNCGVDMRKGENNEKL